MNKMITLLSGGMDSTVATHMAAAEGKVLAALTFDYGQRAAKREILTAKATAKKLGIPHRVIALDWLASLTSTALVNKNLTVPVADINTLGENANERARAVWVPNRNGVFLAIAASFAESMECDTIIAGFNKEEAATFPDNSKDFIDAFNVSLSFSTLSKVKVISPTAGMTKTEIAKKLFELGLSQNDVWPCYHGGEKICGECESCVRFTHAIKEVAGFSLRYTDAG